MNEEKAAKVPLYCWIWAIVSLVAIAGCLYYRYIHPEKYDGTYWKNLAQEEFIEILDNISEDGEIVHIIEMSSKYDIEKEKQLIEKEKECGYELVSVDETRMYFKLVEEGD